MLDVVITRSRDVSVQWNVTCDKITHNSNEEKNELPTQRQSRSSLVGFAGDGSFSSYQMLKIETKKFSMSKAQHKPRRVYMHARYQRISELSEWTFIIVLHSWLSMPLLLCLAFMDETLKRRKMAPPVENAYIDNSGKLSGGDDSIIDTSKSRFLFCTTSSSLLDKNNVICGVIWNHQESESGESWRLICYQLQKDSVVVPRIPCAYIHALVTHSAMRTSHDTISDSSSTATVSRRRRLTSRFSVTLGNI